MNNLVNLEEFRIKNSPNYAKVGDTVEWEDYDGEKYYSRVTAISRRGIDMEFPVDIADLKLNDEYIFQFENGFTVAGFVVRRKVLKKRSA